MISVWPLIADANVNYDDLFYSFIDKLFAGEGVLQATDLNVTPDTNGIGVIISKGGAVVAYDSPVAGKRIFWNGGNESSAFNEFQNSGFDTDLAGWNAFPGSPTITRDTAEFHTGPASMKVVTNAASAFTVGMSLSSTHMRVPANRDLEVSCWVKAPVNVGIRLKVTQHNAAGTDVGNTSFEEQFGTGAWRKLINKFKTGATTAFIWVEVTINSGSSQTYWVDDFEITKNFNWSNNFKPPHPSLPRVDRIVAQVRDQNVSGSTDPSTDGKFRVVSGTPTSGANLTNLSGAAAVPANSFLIANVLVPTASGPSALVAGNIDNTVKATSGLNVPAPPAAFTMPPGIFFEYGGTAAPTGYLLCDGAAVSRTTYANLFAVLGTKYGVGDGSTTFNVPDFRGRVAVGLGTHADVNAIGDSDGMTTVADRRPKHRHNADVFSVGDHSHDGQVGGVGDHTHSVVTVNTISFTEGTAGGIIAAAGAIGGATGSSGAHGHSINGDGAHDHAIDVGPQTAVPTDGPAWLTVNKIVSI